MEAMDERERYVNGNLSRELAVIAFTALDPLSELTNTSNTELSYLPAETVPCPEY